MSLVQLQKASTAPSRWRRSIRANLITSLDQLDAFYDDLHATISDYKIAPPLYSEGAYLFGGTFLVPGGRYLIHSNKSTLEIYDLGEVDSPRYSGFPPVDSTRLEGSNSHASPIGVVQRDDSTLRVIGAFMHRGDTQ